MEDCLHTFAFSRSASMLLARVFLPPVLLAVIGATCSSVEAQTLPLPPGYGFDWEQVGDDRRDFGGTPRFDQEGTLWMPDPVSWLDLSNGFPGVWHSRPPTPHGDDLLALGPHPSGGPARADTVIITLGGPYRSVNGGGSWVRWEPEVGRNTIYQIPAPHPIAGRILVGHLPAYSDDSGVSWTGNRYVWEDLPFDVQSFHALPGPQELPGAGSGRDPAAPANWPSGRIVAAGRGGIAIVSDDGGDTFTAPHPLLDGLDGEYITVVRRPDDHPLGPGPRVLIQGDGEILKVSIWSSDDGGQTWETLAYLDEPVDRPGTPDPAGLFALSEPGEDDPGAGGRVLAILAGGHMYQTTDAGESWQLVGRAPEMEQPQPSTFVKSSAIGPDGRLYINVARLGPEKAWMWRTVDPFFVADESGPAPPSDIVLSVRPNPAGALVSIALVAPEPGAAAVSVFDTQGREVALVFAGDIAAGERSFSIDTSGWAAGVYVVRSDVAGQVASARLVVGR